MEPSSSSYAEAVRQRERNLVARLATSVDGLTNGLLGDVDVPYVALAVQHFGRANEIDVDLVGVHQAAGTQERVHRSRCVGGHHDQRTRRGQTLSGCRNGEVDTDRVDVVGKHLAQLIVSDLADERSRPTTRRHTGHGVGGRTPRSFGGRRHRSVEVLCAIGVYQRHGALDQALFGHEGLGFLADYVDNRVANPHYVISVLAHGGRAYTFGRVRPSTPHRHHAIRLQA